MSAIKRNCNRSLIRCPNKEETAPRTRYDDLQIVTLLYLVANGRGSAELEIDELTEEMDLQKQRGEVVKGQHARSSSARRSNEKKRGLTLSSHLMSQNILSSSCPGFNPRVLNKFVSHLNPPKNLSCILFPTKLINHVNQVLRPW